MRPIFILYARSFWLGIMPALLTMIDMLTLLLADEANHGPVSAAIGALQPWWDADQVLRVMQALTPVCVLIVAHQRRGQNRPYTADPRAL